MAGAGFAPATIDAMPMGDVIALLAYWRTHPPAADILAAAYGVVPPAAAARPDPADPSNIAPLLARHPGGAMRR